MKTVFKVGMKVYDQFNSPDMEGVVVEVIDNECDDYPIVVSFQKYDIYYYTPEGRFNKSDIPTLSTKPYKIEFQGFEQKSPAPEFYEALEWLDNNKNYQTVFEDERTYPSKEIYEAFEALRKLIILRDYYNEGWQPDWSNSIKLKYIIKVSGKEIVIDNTYNIKRTMSFKSKEIRNKFLEEQRELLEIAKPLL